MASTDDGEEDDGAQRRPTSRAGTPTSRTTEHEKAQPHAVRQVRPGAAACIEPPCLRRMLNGSESFRDTRNQIIGVL